MKGPLFSVIINAYNVEKFIDDTLMSLWSQNFGDFETILVDDGSTDSTSVKLKKFAALHPRTTLLNEGHHGLLLARRLGLSHAHGSYILFLDGDDCLHPEALKRCASIIMDSDADIVAFRFSRNRDFLQADGPRGLAPGVYTGKKYLEIKQLVSKGCFVNIWGKAFRRSCVDISADYTAYEGLSQAEDVFQLLPIIDTAKSLILISDILYFYRPNPHSLTSRFRPDMLNDIERVSARLRKYTASWGETFRKSGLAGEASLYLYILDIAFLSGTRRQAQTDFRLLRSAMIQNGALDRMQDASLSLRLRLVRFFLVHSFPRALSMFFDTLRLFKQQLSWIRGGLRIFSWR